MENVIIIGSGCAGLTAAIYTGRANLSPLVITGNEFGGQIATTTEVENYPGFPTGLQGPELTEGMKQQAERFGARLEYDEVIEVELNRQPIIVKTHNATYETKALIVASGASPRKLNIPGEKELTGRGVSYCATCDGFFFKSKEIMVVAHYDCGMRGLSSKHVLEKAEASGISATSIETLRNAAIDLDGWLTGFDDVGQSVRHSVEMIRNHPLMPKSVPVHGLVIHPTTGKLDLMVNGYDNVSDDIK